MSKDKLQEIRDKVNRCYELYDKLDLLKSIYVKEIDAQQCGNLGRTIDQGWLKVVFEAGVTTTVGWYKKELEELLGSIAVVQFSLVVDDPLADHSESFNKDQ